MSEPRLTRLSKLDGEASATALAKYLLEASDAAALAGYLSIIVNVPKPFSLTIAEARAIADRLAGKDLRDARARIAELEVALREINAAEPSAEDAADIPRLLLHIACIRNRAWQAAPEPR